MRVLSRCKKLIMIIGLGYIALSCSDNCKYKYQEGLEIELLGISDRNLVNTVFVTKDNDSIVKDNSSLIFISGGYQTRDQNISLVYGLGQRMIGGKIVIFFSNLKYEITNLKYEIFSCDPGPTQKSKSYIEFRSFDFADSTIVLVEDNVSQSLKGRIKL